MRTEKRNASKERLFYGNIMDESPIIKICISEKCSGRGSAKVADALEQECADSGTIEKSSQCFGYCGMGPNVAVNGNILHHMRPQDAAPRVKTEIAHPSPKKHGLGEKTLDDLDDVLDDFF